jgi:hypothetical protein
LNKRFYEKSNITDVDNPVNITYGELLKKSPNEVDVWIDELRDYVITNWDDKEKPQPPVIGQNEEDIIKKWSKLHEVNVNEFFDKKTGVIRNFNKLASGVNQFFPTMLKTKISSGVSSENAHSIYDMFSEDDYRDKFSKAMKRGLYKDSMYSFGKTLKREDILDVENYIKEINNDKDFGLTIIQQKNKHQVSEKGTWLSFTGTEVKDLLKRNILTKDNIRTLDNVELDDTIELKNGQTRYYHYHCRQYNRNQRIFPTALQIFRLGLGQPAVNFPALTARLLYEYFTEHIKGDVIVYDPSSGWGGRILGAMCTNRTLHYIGTDPNPDNVGRYENVAEFYNTHCFQSNPFWGDKKKNTYSVFTNGSEEIYNEPNFKKYEGQVDFVFTSPPYFNREQYSQDENQSFKKFSAYEDWRDNFLKPTLTTAYKMLKDDRYICWNIADIKVGSDKFIPLEQDSIDILEDLGCTYEGKLKMLMTKMIGLNPKQGKNSVEVNGNYFKFEPILVFRKG